MTFVCFLEQVYSVIDCINSVLQDLGRALELRVLENNFLQKSHVFSSRNSTVVHHKLHDIFSNRTSHKIHVLSCTFCLCEWYAIPSSDHKDWKRPPRSWNPKFAQIPPLNYNAKCYSMLRFLLALGHSNFDRDFIALEATDRHTEKFPRLKAF